MPQFAEFAAAMLFGAVCALVAAKALGEVAGLRRRRRRRLKRLPIAFGPLPAPSDPYRGHLRVVADQQAPVKVYCRDCRFRHEERWDEYYCTAVPLPREQWSGRKLTACGDANREHDCKHFQPGIRSWWERRHSA